MNHILRLQSVFDLTDISFTERMKIAEAHFEVESTSLPSYINVIDFLSAMPHRDKITISLTDDSDEIFKFVSTETSESTLYTVFCQGAILGEMVTVSVEIEKGIENSCFSIYDYDSFSSDVLSLSCEQALLSFSSLLQDTNQLFFEVFNRDCFVKTKTMVFFSGEHDIIPELFNRQKRLQECKDASYFLNLTSYPLIPDDFQVEVDFADNHLTDLFAKLSTILSLIYISSSAIMDNGEIKIQISGQRNIEFSYVTQQIRSNPELYKIYHWIYTDGNAIDKALLARNILCLHCKFSEIKNIDGKTLASIQSNFNLYLKDNVEKYIDLKNKLAEFISDVISKTGDYATKLLDKFKSNLVAVFGFLFTVMLANIVSDQPLDNIFTRDITIILEAVLLGSAVYLIICVIEINYQKKKAKESYDKLKKNYDSVLSKDDIEDIFDGDKLMRDMTKSVNIGIIGYSILWGIFIVIAIFAIELASSEPLFLKEFLALISAIN